MLREAKHSRSRRTPCPRTVPAAMQGVLSTLSTGLCPLPNPQQGVLSAPLDLFPRKQHLRSPSLSQIFPPRIHRLNQSNLLRPSPSLQLFLPPNGLVNVVKLLVVHQPVAMIFTGKSLNLSPLVLHRSPIDAVRHPDVKRPRPATNDVGVVSVFFHQSPNPHCLPERSFTTISSNNCHPERNECFAKRSIHAVEGPLLRLNFPCRLREFSQHRQHRVNALTPLSRRPLRGVLRLHIAIGFADDYVPLRMTVFT